MNTTEPHTTRLQTLIEQHMETASKLMGEAENMEEPVLLRDAGQASYYLGALLKANVLMQQATVALMMETVDWSKVRAREDSA